jgi:hypothetical protein
LAGVGGSWRGRDFEESRRSGKKENERGRVGFFFPFVFSFLSLTIFFAFEVNASYMGSAKGGNTSHHISFPAFPLKKNQSNSACLNEVGSVLFFGDNVLRRKKPEAAPGLRVRERGRET